MRFDVVHRAWRRSDARTVRFPARPAGANRLSDGAGEHRRRVGGEASGVPERGRERAAELDQRQALDVLRERRALGVTRHDRDRDAERARLAEDVADHLAGERRGIHTALSG